MSISIELRDGAARLFDDLAALTEHVGFFLADWDQTTQRFLVHGWRQVVEAEYEVLNDFHVQLRDEMRASVIQWAWSEAASLIELHSHGPLGRARFSYSDLAGFDEWVPHLWWRLRGRPYAALVTTGESVDGFAWVSSPTEPEQVEALVLGATSVGTSGATFEWLAERYD